MAGIALYADKALTAAWQAKPKADGGTRLPRQPVENRNE